MSAGSKARKGELQFAEGEIGAVQIKLLATTAQTLVPGQGDGTFIELVSGTLILEAGTEVLAETADNLAICYTNESGEQLSDTIECTGFIDQSADTVTLIQVNETPSIFTRAESNNAPLVLANLNDDFTGNSSNDSKLHWRVAYRVHYFFQ
jgi:hypothetical protein